MRLLRVELTRFRSRRAIVLMLLGALLLAAALAVSTVWETRPVAAAERAAAERMAATQAQRPMHQRELRACQRDPERYFGQGTTAEDCARTLPDAGWFLPRAELSLQQEAHDSGFAVLVLTSALMIIVGSTFAGADWASGSMSNQLLFEPRRRRVWSAKAAAVLAGSVAVTALLVAGFWAVLSLAAQARDLPTREALEVVLPTAGRGVLLAGAAALGGYALTMLVRHTVGTLAVMFGYAVGGEVLLASLPVEGAGRWSLANNVLAWLNGGHRYYDESIVCPPGPGYCDQMAPLTLADAGVYLGGLLLVVAMVSLVLFRRRDIP